MDATDVGTILRDHERAQSRANRYSQSQAGDYFVRLLPPILDPTNPQPRPAWRECGKHYDFDILREAPGTRPGSVWCPQACFGLPCFADHVNEALFRKAQGSDGTINENLLKQAKSTSTAPRFLANVLPVTAGNELLQGLGPKVLEFGVQVVIQFRSLFKDWPELTHPLNGNVIGLTYMRDRGVSLKHVRATTVRGPLPYDRWVEERHDLDAYLRQECPSPEEMKAFFIRAAAPTDGHVGTPAAAPDPVVPAVPVSPAPAPAAAAPAPTGPTDINTLLKLVSDGVITPAQMAEALQKQAS